MSKKDGKTRIAVSMSPLEQVEAMKNRPDWIKDDLRESWNVMTSTRDGYRISKRDAQRKKLYHCDNVLAARYPGRKFTTHQQIVSYLEGLFKTKWYQRRWPESKYRALSLTTKRSSKGQHGSATRGLMRLFFPPTGEIEEWLVLHELAHHLAPQHKHWNRFVRIYLELVKFKIGREAYECLRAACKAEGVKYHRSPKRRNPSKPPRTMPPARYMVLGEDPSGEPGKLVMREERTRGQAEDRLAYLHREGWIGLILADRCQKKAWKVRVDIRPGGAVGLALGGTDYTSVVG